MTGAPVLHETSLSPRLVVLTLGGDTPATSYGTNCLALAGGHSTLLVDPLIAPAHARQVEEAVRRRGFPPVRHVVVTHHHTARRIVPGHGAPGGAELLERQAAYHAEVARLVRAAGGAAAARAAVLARFPGLLLEAAVESAILAHARRGG